MTEPTYYEVLALPKALVDDSNAEQIPIIIKQAYHRALLRHHPDKAPQALKTPSRTSIPSSSSTQTTFTIDQITTAYTTLSSPTLRAEYNTHIRTARDSANHPAQSTFQTGIETIDLDDLDYSDSDARWFKPCRCGNERGFTFGESDLEEAGDLGELIVGCQDCSLWLRVCFAVVEDDDDVERGGTSCGRLGA